jgi:hypothetical protein
MKLVGLADLKELGFNKVDVEVDVGSLDNPTYELYGYDFMAKRNKGKINHDIRKILNTL